MSSAPKRRRFSLAETVLMCTDPSQVLEEDLPILDGNDTDINLSDVSDHSSQGEEDNEVGEAMREEEEVMMEREEAEEAGEAVEEEVETRVRARAEYRRASAQATS
ncbi:protein bfr2-like [Alosa sapidissima]|uniref:protein bfr2-like n=1 Tax=Alosa sapidissima TaxID=34773 RepID=UPI001C094A97|nr:protein bfr2-like [Alosa sapidissima]